MGVVVEKDREGERQIFAFSANREGLDGRTLLREREPDIAQTAMSEPCVGCKASKLPARHWWKKAAGVQTRLGRSIWLAPRVAGHDMVQDVVKGNTDRTRRSDYLEDDGTAKNRRDALSVTQCGSWS